MNTFWGIWTFPYGEKGGGYTIRTRLRYTEEWFWRTLAHHLPRRLAYWSLIDSGVRYMKPKDEVPAVPFMQVLENFSKSETVDIS